MSDITNGWADAINELFNANADKEVYITRLSMDEVKTYYMSLRSKTALTENDRKKLSVCRERLIAYAVDNINAKRETKETLKALMADMERIEPSTWDGENIKRTCICMVLEYMEGEE